MRSQIECLATISPTRRGVSLPPDLLHALAAVALDEALDGVEQIGPHRLRAEIAAPDAAADRVHQEQRHRRDDQEAGEVIDLLRPQLDEEEIEAPAREIDQHRLARRVRPAIPAHEGQDVIDREAEPHQRPFDVPIGAGDALRIDLSACGVERGLVDFEFCRGPLVCSWGRTNRSWSWRSRTAPASPNASEIAARLIDASQRTRDFRSLYGPKRCAESPLSDSRISLRSLRRTSHYAPHAPSRLATRRAAPRHPAPTVMPHLPPPSVCT